MKLVSALVGLAALGGVALSVAPASAMPAGENLKAFATNLRRSGPVFYKDKESKQAPAATPAPKPE